MTWPYYDEMMHQGLTSVQMDILNSEGSTCIRNGASEIVTFSRSLGRPVPSRPGGSTVDQLRPLPMAAAHPRSLSAIYGSTDLPWHMDTANWPTPCRYVLLAAPRSADTTTPTLLLKWRRYIAPDDEVILRRAVFRIRSGRHSFFSTAFDVARHFLRFDPGCMEPASSDASEAVARLRLRLRQARPTPHHWKQGDLLIIDNWKMFHSRPATHSYDRCLLRTLVTT